MNFSQRIGQEPATKELQLNSIDRDLKNSLWNVFKLEILDRINYLSLESFNENLWVNYFKDQVDFIPIGEIETRSKLRNYFFNCEWDKVYNFLEFIAELDLKDYITGYVNYIENCNLVLEREFSGYRFIDNKIVPITNTEEVKEIEYALSNSNNYSALSGANVHIRNAVNKLSDRNNPDYRNSIKESISAVENVAKSISENKKDSLGGAIDKLKDKIKIHPALEKGLKNIYGYTSDTDGIRHALMSEENSTFEDAKFMLILCSAFVNYLVVKAEKCNINIEN